MNLTERYERARVYARLGLEEPASFEARRYGLAPDAGVWKCRYGTLVGYRPQVGTGTTTRTLLSALFDVRAGLCVGLQGRTLLHSRELVRRLRDWSRELGYDTALCRVAPVVPMGSGVKRWYYDQVDYWPFTSRLEGPELLKFERDHHMYHFRRLVDESTDQDRPVYLRAHSSRKARVHSAVVVGLREEWDAPRRAARLAAKLERAVEAFRSFAVRKGFDDPSSASDSCDFASDAFLHELSQHHGLEGVIEHFDPSIELDRRDFPYDMSGCKYHWAVRVGDTVVDWTARQFDPEASFPTVWSPPRRDWRNVRFE